MSYLPFDQRLGLTNRSIFNIYFARFTCATLFIITYLYISSIPPKVYFCCQNCVSNYQIRIANEFLHSFDVKEQVLIILTRLHYWFLSAINRKVYRKIRSWLICLVNKQQRSIGKSDHGGERRFPMLVLGSEKGCVCKGNKKKLKRGQGNVHVYLGCVIICQNLMNGHWILLTKCTTIRWSQC